jgi:glycine/D-amino acid oxidase-like deaminating enzyme
VPDDVPPARAVLAGTVETAVNALWDAPALVGDRVAVVGAGMVGCCVARLLARFPAIDVTLVDVDASRAEVAAALGAGFARPDGAAGGCDLVVHTSATSAGLQCSLDLLAPRHGARARRYSDTEASLRRVPCGPPRCAPAGTVSPPAARGARRRPAGLALPVARPPFDALVTGEPRFGEPPDVMARLAAGACWRFARSTR